MPNKLTAYLNDREGFDKHYKCLTDKQRQFVDLLIDWIKRPRKLLVTLSGGPGTGKTFAVKKTLSFVMANQLRMAHTARAATAIGGRTIHSYVRLNFEKGSVYKTLEQQLEKEMDVNVCIENSRAILDEFDYGGSRPDIIVVDEISMINVWTMHWLVRYFMDKYTTPLLFIAMGDKNQLCPVRSNYNFFSAASLIDLYEVHFITLVESKRFTPQYEILVNRMRKFVDSGDLDGMFTLLCAEFPIVDEIDSSLLRQASRAMAFLNASVDYYNSFYMDEILQDNTIVRLYTVLEKRVVETSFINVKKNCLIFVTQNGHGEASNGTLLVFRYYNSVKDVLVCTEPGQNKIINVKRNLQSGSFPIALGFAGTVHKFQGDTLDCENIVINFGGNRDLNLVYTALSRVRDKSQILAIKL